MVRIAIAVVALWLVSTPPSDAILLVTSEPVSSPEQVVKIQLEALQQNDDPEPDAGIARVWDYAHPANKVVTGPLHRFTLMIKGGSYKILINHLTHEIEAVTRSDDHAVFKVMVTGEDRTVAGFIWVVSKLKSGEHPDAWMTMSVSVAQSLGQEI